MKHHPISPDDPRLTSYALNEMAPDERTAFESELSQNPAAQQAVEQIRRAGAMLTAALQHEAATPEEVATPAPATHTPGARIIRFPFWMVSSLAAACFSVAFIYWQRDQMASAPVDSSTAPIVAAEYEAKAMAADRKEVVASGNMVEVAGARSAASPAPQPAPVAMAAPPPTPNQAQMNRVQAVEHRAVSETAKAEGGAMEKQRADRAQYGMAKRSISTNAPLTDARQLSTDAYAYHRDNGFLTASQNPLSTFSVDVDTASYANVRRFLLQGQRPPADAVRIEEMVNYFPYRYAGPDTNDPIAASLEVASAPWAPTHRLVRIGLRGQDIKRAARPAANLVFLLDVSGSMNQPNKLPLLKKSLHLLVDKLRADDRVAIAVYAGASGLALPSTSADKKAGILAAIDRLQAEGSTNGALGIQLAYDIAKANFIRGGINRVILATDGDFNVGVTSEGELVRLIEEKAKSGVFLTVLGFGMGNLKDSTLEKLADKGNGHYGYIDSRKEAEKLFVQQVNGTLVTIAKDVKIQVEFNPSQVASYRLIGYENRRLATEDFGNDKVDAGEIGAGHTVTALYEVIPVAVAAKAKRPEPEVEERRYNFYGGVTDNATVPGRIDPFGKEMLLVKVRYKKPDGLLSRRLDFPLTDAGGKFANASPDFKFAAAVAGFGMILRESPHKGTATMAQVVEWAEAGADEDVGGYRSEFIELARHADGLEK